MGRPTLIRPPSVKRQNPPVAQVNLNGARPTLDLVEGRADVHGGLIDDLAVNNAVKEAIRLRSEDCGSPGG
jgi:hypothetical protein